MVEGSVKKFAKENALLSQLFVIDNKTAISDVVAQAGKAGSCVKLASVIERHLKALAGHGDLNPVLRATCQQLSEQWAEVVDKSLPPPARPRLFPSFGARSH